MRIKKIISVVALAVFLFTPTVQAACKNALYGHNQEKVVLYQRASDMKENIVRYLFVDGRRGILGKPGAEVSCNEDRLLNRSGKAFESIELKEQDISFRSSGLDLVGKLVDAAGGAGSDKPLVVFVHGSESTPTVGYSPYPYILAAQGISVFVYDKRGTGQSGGHYSQDLIALAGDAAAAAEAAKRMASGRYNRFGYYGGSQGGWVAPLAAKTTNADFIVIGFGLLLSPVEEDAEQVYDELRRMGYGEDVIDLARDVTAATGEIIASHFTKGFEDLTRVRKKYANTNWLGKIEGEFTGMVLAASEHDLRKGIAGDFEDSGVPWRHNAVDVIRSLSVPQLWVIAGDDIVAPGSVTRDRLELLRKEGLPLTTALFPKTDHGMLDFTLREDGSRIWTRFTEGYFRLIADFMKSRLEPPYGRGQITEPRPE
ncbi:alpha/beta hydrolase family protein [Emcibacter sp.]|uniref:alpha/beta hydrolase family protein n=1 Tax=Emcibacter sp. TaxID=1979954 RepID=UPI003A8D2D69